MIYIFIGLIILLLYIAGFILMLSFLEDEGKFISHLLGGLLCLIIATVLLSFQSIILMHYDKIIHTTPYLEKEVNIMIN